jgi:hypothetical protein
MAWLRHRKTILLLLWHYSQWWTLASTIFRHPVLLSSTFGTQAFLLLPPLHLSISALDGPFLFALPDY